MGMAMGATKSDKMDLDHTAELVSSQDDGRDNPQLDKLILEEIEKNNIVTENEEKNSRKDREKQSSK